MSITVLSESNPTARKLHNCDASDFVLSAGISDFGYSFAELRVIAKARTNRYKIQKGERYLRQGNLCDGELYTFKAIPAMHDICIRHSLYEN